MVSLIYVVVFVVAAAADDVAMPTQHHMSCLTWASGRGHTEIVRELIQYNARVTTADKVTDNQFISIKIFVCIILNIIVTINDLLLVISLSVVVPSVLRRCWLTTVKASYVKTCFSDLKRFSLGS